MSDSEGKPLRRFQDLNSREQAELIEQARMVIAELLGQRVLAVCGVEQSLMVKEKVEAHTRYRPFLN